MGPRIVSSARPPHRTATVLIAIKPHFASAILQGSKRFELRRFVPRFSPADRLLIYASSPTRRVVGSCSVVQVAAGTPQEVWKAIGEGASGIDRGGFFAYLGSSPRCAAIELARPVTFDPPLSLPFRPPQSYCFVRHESPEHLELLQQVGSIPDHG